ncbi:MAG: serine/threonine-protein kinase [Gemmataceae bacterium]
MSDPAVAQSANRDEQLARLLADLTDQLHHGRQPDLDGAALAHPELAGELRELWGTVLFTEALVKPSSDAPSTLPWPSPGLASPPPSNLKDYDLLETLGQGGQGVVYKARQRSLNRLVALKTIRSDRTDEENRSRFRAEAKEVARLDHTNIVPVYDVGECDSQLYFSMKYVDGLTLAKLLANGPLPPREAARLLVAIADAIHYAHEHGILHRDLKPSNILLGPVAPVSGPKPADRLLDQWTPYVTDFGLAKRVSSDELQASITGGAGARLTATNAILGTPSYMPPEQVDSRRGQLRRASDVYSLGAILYEMLTGRPPFLAADPVDIIFRVLDQDPVAPRRLNPSVDRDLELICLKCLQKPAELRYATAAQLADDLRKFLNYERPSVWSGSFMNLISTALRETHHAPVLENWGTLWMWHSLQILLLCGLTNALAWCGVESHLAYVELWSLGLCSWGVIFWNLRKRGGPVQFIERQIAHVWGAAIIGTIGIFIVEVLLGLPPLKLSPLLAVIAGMTFVVKAGMLSGLFYFQAAALFLTAIPMALFPQVGPLLFGLVTAASFFIPGWKYSRQRERSGSASS